MRLPGWRQPVVLAASVLLLAALPAAAQEKPPSSEAFLQGTEAFRRVLFDTGKELFPTGFQPVDSFNGLDDPRHTLLIVFGDAQCLTQVPNGLGSFLRQGGALFLATDKAPRDDAEASLAQSVGVMVVGKSVICTDKDSCYHQLEYCPYLQPFEEAKFELFRNLLSNEYSPAQAASNAPSSLLVLPRFDRLGLHQLARLPDDCYPEDAVTQSPYFPPPLFAVGGDVGRGRVLVMADHSVFINAMLLQKDNGNVHLAYNSLKWLTGDERDPRTRVLFVEDGRINTRFEVPLRDSSDELAKRMQDYLLHHPDALARLAFDFVLHHPDAAVKMTPALAEAAKKAAPVVADAADKKAPEVEQKIQEIDQRDGFNRALLYVLGVHGDPYERLLPVLAVLLAVLLVLYGCWKIGWKARHRSDLQRPLLAAALRRLAPEGAVMAQRRLALERGGNLWEPAHDLALQCLSEAGVPTGDAVPPVTVRGGWMRRWTMTGCVKRLWRLAYGPPSRVTLTDWHRLVREVQELKTALAKGTVAFISAIGNRQSEMESGTK